MAKYWLKASPDAAADGPLSAAEVKRRAASGAIARTTLISTDQATWHPAGRVKGVFVNAATAAAPVAAAAAHAKGNGQFAQSDETSPASSSTRPARRPIPPVYPGMERRHITSTAVAPPAQSPEQSTSPAAEVGTGDIESQPPMPMPPITEPTAAPAPPPLPAAAQHAPLSYATPRGMSRGIPTPLRPRKTDKFLVVAILMVPVGLMHAYEWYVGIATRGSAEHDFTRALVCLAWVCLVIPVFVMWIKWVTAAHRDAGPITGYRHSISPSKATGLMFVPFFNAIWAVLMPAKLASTVNEALEAAGLPKISAGKVAGCQLAATIAPLLGLYALTPLLYAITMRTIQGGLNRLAAHQYA